MAKSQKEIEEELLRRLSGQPETEASEDAARNELAKRLGVSQPKTTAEVAQSEELNEPSFGGGLKHALTGLVSGVGDTIDFPSAVAEAVVNNLPLNPFSPYPSQMRNIEVPRPTEGYKRLVDWSGDLAGLEGEGLGQAIAEEIRPEYTYEQIQENPMLQYAQAGRTGLEFFLPGSPRKAELARDAVVSGTAAGGEWLGNKISEGFGTAGEIFGSGTAMLAQLLRGKPRETSPIDAQARDIISQNLTGDMTPAQAAAAVREGLNRGEAGSVGDLTRNTGVMRIEESLRGTDQNYADQLYDLGMRRSQQQVDDVTLPLRRDPEARIYGPTGRETAPPIPPAIDEAGAPYVSPARSTAQERQAEAVSAAESATQDRLAQQQAESAAIRAQLTGRAEDVAAREIPSPVPAMTAAEEAQMLAAQRAGEVASARQQLTQAEEAYGPVRLEQINAQVPSDRQSQVFEGIPETDVRARQQAANDWWQADAFSEVKNADYIFEIPKGTLQSLKRAMREPQFAVQLEDHLGSIAEAMRRMQGFDPSFKKLYIEDGRLNIDAYLEDMAAGKFNGQQMMALRNFFAGSSDFANQAIKRDLDEVIIKSLPKDDAARYVEQIDLYPQHLAQKRTAQQSGVYLEEGRYTPEQRVGATGPVGRPRGEEDVAAYQARKQAEGGLAQATDLARQADLEAKAADRAANRASSEEARLTKAKEIELRRAEQQIRTADKQAESALTKIEREGAKEVEGLNKSLQAEYAKNGSSALKPLLTKPDRADDLARLYDSFEDPAQKSAFRQDVARELVNSMTAADGSLLPNARGRFQDMHETLYNSGLLRGDDATEIQAALNNAVEDAARRANVSGSVKANEKRVSELGSTAAAALAVNLLPGTSTSLIAGGAIRRAVNRFLKNRNGTPEQIADAVKQLTVDPRRFIEAMEASATEEEAVENLMRLWTVMAQNTDEEEER